MKLPRPLILQSRIENVVIGILFVGIGIYGLLDREGGARRGARFHQRLERRLPWLYWPRPKGSAGSEPLWRVLAPLIAMFLIAGGVVLIFLPPN